MNSTEMCGTVIVNFKDWMVWKNSGGGYVGYNIS